MSKFVTDHPISNVECMLNLAYTKDHRVFLRWADGKKDVDLCEYISYHAREKGCDVSPDDVMNGSCLECDCKIATLNNIAIQAAELRGKLKRYEDTEMNPAEIEAMKGHNTALIAQIDDLTHPVKPYGRHTDFRCGACKRRIRSGNGSSSRIRDKFCQGCGRPIDWDALKEDEQ